MKILIALLIGGLLLIPSTVGAIDCERCCDLYSWQQYYEVKYFNESHEWTSEIVEAWTAREAAEKLGLRAGYDCFVSFSHTVHEPILNTYEVWYNERVESGFYTPWGTPMYSHVWTYEIVEAEDSYQAANMLGLRAGYDCFVKNV